MKKKYRNRISDEAQLAAMSPGERRRYAGGIKGLSHQEYLAIYRSRRFLTAFLCAMLLPSGGAIIRFFMHHELFAPMPGLFISAGVSACLIHSMFSGISSSNHGIFFRKTEPVRFWIQNTILALAYFAAIFVTWYAH